MHSSLRFHSGLLFVSLLAAALLSGCGDSHEGGGAATNAIEKHVLASEAFGATLADIHTKADFERAQPALLRQARALVDSIDVMNTEIMDNADLAEAGKRAAIEPYEMRLAAAERLWRTEARRIAGTLGDDVFAEIGGIIFKPR